MDITIFLARFWGSLFIILGLSSIGARLLGRVINYTKEKTITISTGYITFLLGLATVVAHNVWVTNWKVGVTLLGWITLFKGIEKIAFPERVHKAAQKFKSLQILWSLIILGIGLWFFLMSFN